MSSSLIDTEAGGDSQFDQYTSQASGLGAAPSTSKGQLGATASDTSAAADAAVRAGQKAERGERTAENVRYGQGVSEGGFGGTTTELGDSGTGGGGGKAGREAQGYAAEEGGEEIGA